jgi:hypothetical protein
MVESLKEKPNPNKATRSEIVDALTIRDGFFCYICKKPFKSRKEVTIEHWWPLCHGGTWALDNLRLACQPCNNLKGDALPNPDGSVNFVNRKIKTIRLPRPEFCDHCMSGRILLIGETCDICGSGPQPTMFPTAYKTKSKNCDHDKYHCFKCIIGLVKRKS